MFPHVSISLIPFSLRLRMLLLRPSLSVISYFMVHCRNLCNKVVFDIADSDQNNTLSFDEFVLGVCVVCTLTRDQLLYFVFRCFDLDDR